MNYTVGLYHTGTQLSFRFKHSRVLNALPLEFGRGFDDSVAAMAAWLEHEDYRAQARWISDSWCLIEFQDPQSYLLFSLKYS